jgi:hypothetical protein
MRLYGHGGFRKEVDRLLDPSGGTVRESKTGLITIASQWRNPRTQWSQTEGYGYFTLNNPDDGKTNFRHRLVEEVRRMAESILQSDRRKWVRTQREIMLMTAPHGQLGGKNALFIS